MLNYCPNCGSELNGNEKFCSNCGALIIIDTPKVTDQTQAVEQSPTITTSFALKNQYAWCLAIIPFILSWILENKMGPDYSILAVIIIPIILNIIFVSADRKMLTASNFNTNGWAWIGFFIPPIYLFMRAAKTNGKYGCAIVCTFLFVIHVLHLSVVGILSPTIYAVIRLR